MNVLAARIRELFKAEPLPPVVEAFGKSFPVTRELPDVYFVWENRLGVTGMHFGLGTIYNTPTLDGKEHLVYVPCREHS